MKNGQLVYVKMFIISLVLQTVTSASWVSYYLVLLACRLLVCVFHILRTLYMSSSIKNQVKPIKKNDLGRVQPGEKVDDHLLDYRCCSIIFLAG